MSRSSTTAPGPEQRSTSQETDGRYVYAVIDDTGDQEIPDLHRSG